MFRMGEELFQTRQSASTIAPPPGSAMRVCTTTSLALARRCATISNVSPEYPRNLDKYVLMTYCRKRGRYCRRFKAVALFQWRPGAKRVM